MKLTLHRTGERTLSGLEAVVSPASPPDLDQTSSSPPDYPEAVSPVSPPNLDQVLSATASDSEVVSPAFLPDWGQLLNE